MAINRSSSVICKKCLKKPPVKPLVPGNFSSFRSKTALFNSSLMKGTLRCCRLAASTYNESQFIISQLWSSFPISELKSSNRICSLSLCSVTFPYHPCRVGMWFFCLLPFSLKWKSLVLMSPALIQVNIYLCLHLTYSTTAMPKSLAFRNLLSFHSSSERGLSSIAKFELKMTSLATHFFYFFFNKALRTTFCMLSL